MGSSVMADLGRHCSVEECKLVDFLPFTCDRCKQVFCLQHRSCTKHQCRNAHQMDVTILICPLCAQGVRLIPNEDPNITWDNHVNCDCDPSNYQKATKKKYCPVLGCKETLVFSNKIRCRDCNQEHCLRHRFGPDHNCLGSKKTEIGFPFINVLRRSQKGEPTIQTSLGSPKWGSSLLNAASSIKASAEAGMQKLSNATNQALRKAKDGMGQGSGAGAYLVEQCLLCRARFSEVTALVEHVEEVHERKNVHRAYCGATIDFCPRCSKAFRDPVLLVEHVEKDHGGAIVGRAC
ncbi:Zinc finger AN1 and C2H2 domain-containing stress-associated protein 16 [Apostasia shenzhenica]|uniref:Zinc finger AN1 and C2H2 domain-containing stress-associated protein 16 n=1 Tax=Apostasia shenzhenica TaxID=1088818 RepID=A0A2I0AZM0_9ASPA|nr:Zinc finger AN1 and C2H2 domain-containing stress-associated protein 16 [Apostasia shenzhenica]